MDQPSARDIEILNAFRETGSFRAAGRRVGVDHKTVARVVRLFEVFEDHANAPLSAPEQAPFERQALPSKDRTAEELIELSCLEYERRKAYAKAIEIVNVKVNVRGPFALLHFGDPHIDDASCDWPSLRRHVRLVQKHASYVFGCNVGDTTNNWIGRLAALYGKQNDTEAEAWIKAKWFIQGINWLYLLAGNHDLWSGDGDPIQWMLDIRNKEAYSPARARLRLQCPNGVEIMVNARHKYKGNSMWNKAHGQARYAQLEHPDDIIVGGHIHCSGYTQIPSKQREGAVSHCIQVGSYKTIDEYARDQNLDDPQISPCAFTVINPEAEYIADRVHYFWHPESGIPWLMHLREEFFKAKK